MKTQLQKKRLPIYLMGFLIGTMGVFLLTQVKKATAPEFAEVLLERKNPAFIAVGGNVRLQLGDEPGRNLAWGFPTQLMVGYKEAGGRIAPVVRMEYRDLVEKETLIGPFAKAGEYELRAQFFACDQPGQKYCAKISVVWPITATEGPEGLRELPLPVDVKGIAEREAAAGLAREEAAKKAALAPTP